MSEVRRFRLAKRDAGRFISHLDLVRTITRALRRANIEPAFSEGYHPHPLLSFSPALKTGYESEAEYFDVKINHMPFGADLARIMNDVLPGGLRVIETSHPPAAVPALSILDCASYRIWFQTDAESSRNIADLTMRRSLVVTRTSADGKTKSSEVRPFLLAVDNSSLAAGEIGILAAAGNAGNLRPDELLQQTAGVDPERVLRTGLYRRVNEQLVDPMAGSIVNWK